MNLLPNWKGQIYTLPEALRARPSVVRIAYATTGEPADLVRRRIAEIRHVLGERWKALKGRYTLTIEVEGAP